MIEKGARERPRMPLRTPSDIDRSVKDAASCLHDDEDANKRKGSKLRDRIRVKLRDRIRVKLRPNRIAMICPIKLRLVTSMILIYVPCKSSCRRYITAPTTAVAG